MSISSLPRGVPDIDPALTLHLIASGVVAFADVTRDGRPAPVPYPMALQRGFDRLTVLCWMQQATPPASVPDLLAWCHRPLVTWPVDLTVLDIDPGDAFLDGGLLTRACEEWAVASPDPEAHVLERRLLGEVFDICMATGNQDAYVAFRRLLIEEPVLTAFDLLRRRSDPQLAALADQLRVAYQPAPLECVAGGDVLCCVACGNLLMRMRDGAMRCAEERCPESGASRPGRALRASEEVYWLRRDLRAFIAAPGRAELQLAKRLGEMGLAVELWPHFDAYDLRVTFGDGVSWAVDVKDWTNPVLLARRVSPIPTVPPWSRAYFVFPQERLRQTDYVRAFKAHCTVLGDTPPVDAVSERRFVELVRGRARGMA
jgi:REase associating with pPIWI_RE/pPIWI_RE three-gene island domain Y